MSFPDGFVWGAATAAYQVEGAARDDGRGLSVWDMMCRVPGRIYKGHTGDVACDHYHRFREDVAIMKEIGLKGYRFSISWSRVLPTGVGQVNEKGIDFYSQLVDELLAAEITPYITLFHWDYPYDLFCRGGWLNRETVDWFGDYAALLGEKLGDRVRNWMTFNEPQCFVGLGHQEGFHAPGLKLGLPELCRMVHHVLMSHGRAAQALRAGAKGDCMVGIAPVCHPVLPATDGEADVEAARKKMWSVNRDSIWPLPWWFDPIIRGKYPEDGLARLGEYLPIEEGDMEVIAQPLDFIGSNTYQCDGSVKAADNENGWEEVEYPGDRPLTALRWPVVPEALYWVARFLYERYGLPIYITENGMSNADWVSKDGKVHDPQRIDFASRYLAQLDRAIDGGADVRGYFHWTLMDNFEWAEGYKERFGLVYVDFATCERTPKDSARWYGGVIGSNGKEL